MSTTEQPDETYTPVPTRRRKADALAVASDVRHSEMEDLYDRLCELDRGHDWQRWYAVIGQVLAGGVAGALLTGEKMKGVLVVGGVAALFCLVGYLTTKDTKTEDLSSVRRSFKRLMDSFEPFDSPER